MFFWMQDFLDARAMTFGCCILKWLRTEILPQRTQRFSQGSRSIEGGNTVVQKGIKQHL